jgi:hypothetical protein
MERMIKDWNRYEVKKGEVFHFQHSLRPFINIDSTKETDLFLDINEMVAYCLDDLECEGLEFYTKEEDENFKGVEIDGTIKDWF